MNPERWQKVKEIFNATMERMPEERSAFLAGACADDEALNKEVELLIAAHEKDGSFIDAPAYQVAAEALDRDQELKAGQIIEHYEILSTLRLRQVECHGSSATLAGNCLRFHLQTNGLCGRPASRRRDSEPA